MSQVSLPTLAAHSSPPRDALAASDFRDDLYYISDPENRLLFSLENLTFEQLVEFSPILLVGGSGLGKSAAAHHLLAGLCQLEQFNEADVLTLNCTDFYRTYALAVETNSVADWRSRFSAASAILLDGLQQLSGKREVQRELRWLHDEFALENKLVISTSLVPVSELKSFDASLVSRFSAGLVIPMSVPGVAARKAYFEQLCESLHVVIQPQAVADLSSRLACSFPNLKNALTQLKSEHCIGQANNVIDQSAVDNYLKRHSDLHPSLRSIADRVARMFNVKLSDLKGSSRKQSIVRARGIVIHLARTLSDQSLDKIGEFLGKRDHTTILHAFRKTDKLLKTDPLLQTSMTTLLAELKTTTN